MQTQNEKARRLTPYYWDTLAKIADVETVIKDHSAEKSAEVDTVKALAIAGLIRQGVPFRKEYVALKQEGPAVKKVGIFTVTQEDQPDVTQQKLVVIVTDELNRDYQVPGETLQRVMGEKYKRIILDEQPAIEEDEQEKSIILPPLPDEYDESKEAAPAASNTASPEAKNDQDNKERLPVFRSDSHYPEDQKNQKNGWTFLYNKHLIKIPLPQGVAVIKFYVYPLDVKQDEPATDIFVAAESEGLVRGGVSRGESAGVTVEFGNDIRFVVRGSWKNGQFESIVRCMNAEFAKNMSQTTKTFLPNPRMATTYLRTEADGVNIDVFPAKFGTNESNGYALGVCAIESDKNIGISMPGPDGTFILDLGGGKIRMMDCYWLGADEPSFHVEIRDE